MTYKGYAAKIKFDEDARILHGEVAGLRDVVTFQADAASDIEKAFRDSIDDYLAFCKKRGEQPEKPASGKFLICIQPSLHRQLARQADMRGTSLNALVEEYLGQRAVGEPKFARRPKASGAA